MQALDEDQEGPTVVLKKLFEEDREFNQGASSIPTSTLASFACFRFMPARPSMTAQGRKHCRPTDAACIDRTGEFAEAVRDQFMKEREEYFKALEQALLDATMQAPDCTVAQLAAALQKMDPDMIESQVQSLACCAVGRSHKAEGLAQTQHDYP
jgi:hypothetical protein